MSKRFTATEIWGEDWFLNMPNEYKLFWFYMLAHCDHAGVFKVNLRSFSGLLEVKLTTSSALNFFNSGKDRIRVINDSTWFIEDFFVFQYGTTFNLNNRLHESIKKIYENLGIELTSIRGLKDLLIGVKDKDKDKDKDLRSKEVSQFPKFEDFNGLPEIKSGSAVQLIKITQGVDLSSDDVNGLWEIFKVQNLTGKKFYQTEDDVYSHFLNWIKGQKIQKDGNNTQGTGSSDSAKLGTSAARIEALKKW